MRIYVAAKYEDRDFVRSLYRTLESKGHEITCDWTDHDIYPEDAPNNQKAYFAVDDINGVRECDLLIAVFLWERHQRGALIEIGAALGLGKPVAIIGDYENSSTLLQHPGITRFGTVADCLNAIETLSDMNNLLLSVERANR